MDRHILDFVQEANNISELYPELNIYTLENGTPVIKGELKLFDKQGIYIDSYIIAIIPNPNSSFRLPYVYEIGGRIPNNIDWHVFPDGHCCLMSIPEEILLCKKKIGLLSLLNSHVKPYFFNQKFRELNGFFLNERSHGLRGHVEFFEDLLKTTNTRKILHGLKFVRKRLTPSRNDKCFCGSNTLYRKCHRDAFRTLDAFSNNELDVWIKLFSNYNQ